MSDIELDQRWIKHKTEQNESKLVCPFCNQELIREGMNHWWCSCNIANKGRELYGTTSLWQELIRTRKELEQSEICCTEWEKQALDYKAENIALSGELERTRKALDAAKKWLMKIGYLNMLDHGLGSEKMMTDWCKTVALHGLKEIETALEQKDVK